VIEQRSIAMLGDDGNTSLSEIFAQADVPPIGISDGLTRGSGSTQVTSSEGKMMTVGQKMLE
jgi:hypothetical protein